ncbi:MAG: alpha/beta fold hydrolase [Myxococcales bacterium]|nr:alpha/beta fold hydrolase [Myxococcales bacterium]
MARHARSWPGWQWIAWAVLALGLGCDDMPVDALLGAGRGGGPEARRAGPPYPLVLAHGFFGFEDFAGVDFIHYFWQVRDDLEAAGEPWVFTPAVDPFDDSEVRGAQLLARVARIREITGADKVNLIGHSQGGLDARFVAALRPDWVASVTTLSTPHRGSALLDVALGFVDVGPVPDLLDALVRAVGRPLWDAAGEDTSVTSAMRQLSARGAAEFNAAYPDAEGVAYYAIAGRTDYHGGGRLCQADDRPEFITRWDRARDPVDPTLFLMEAALDGGIFDPMPNDGLVTVESARWGRFLGCIPADHLDQMGHLLGDLPGLLNPFRHKVFYRDLVAWLRSQGH